MDRAGDGSGRVKRSGHRCAVVARDATGLGGDVSFPGAEAFAVVVTVGDDVAGVVVAPADPGGIIRGPRLSALADAELGATITALTAGHALRGKLPPFGDQGEPLGIAVVVIAGPGPGDASERCLAELGELDPAPERVVVIDQSPRGDWSRATAGRGFACLSPGAGWPQLASCLDGLPIVAFTTASARRPVNWLAGLAWHFADPLTFAVVGSVLPVDVGADDLERFLRRIAPGGPSRVRQLDGDRVAPRSAAALVDPGSVAIRSCLDPSWPELPIAVGDIIRRGGRVVYAPGRIVVSPDALTLRRRMAPRRRGVVRRRLAPARSISRAQPPPMEPDASLELTVVVAAIASRRAVLLRCLAALAQQTLERGRFEVVVVPNGPGARTMMELPGVDRVLPRDVAGLAGARNAGATAARGGLIVFLDDDILLDPGCLAAFLARHQRDPGAMILGSYYPADLGTRAHEQLVGRWWCDHFTYKLRAGPFLSFSDFIDGTLAAPRRLFKEVGGFDEEFAWTSRRQDWDMGARCLSEGVPLVVEPGASGSHHYEVSAIKLLRDKHAEGFADVLLARRRPAVSGALPLGPVVRRGPLSAVFRVRVGLGRLALGRAAGPVEGVFRVAERLSRRRVWRPAFREMQRAAYTAGAAEALAAGNPLPVITSVRTRLDVETGTLGPHGPAFGLIEMIRDGRSIGAVGPLQQWNREAVVDGLIELLVRHQRGAHVRPRARLRG